MRAGWLARSLTRIAEQCDGVRCDMAMLLTNAALLLPRLESAIMQVAVISYGFWQREYGGAAGDQQEGE